MTEACAFAYGVLALLVDIRKGIRLIEITVLQCAEVSSAAFEGFGISCTAVVTVLH